MPVYEYQCQKCSNKFEVRRGFKDETTAYCPRCKGAACRIFSPVPVIFNGSGFYTTDNRKNGAVSGTGEKQPVTASAGKTE
jgi:putative FmdB family regulatory protein